MLLATLAGLAAAIWAFGSIGFDSVIAVAGRIGVGGFLLYCLWSLGVFAILGGAWLAAAPGEALDRIGWFTWARQSGAGRLGLRPFQLSEIDPWGIPWNAPNASSNSLSVPPPGR